EVVTEQVETEDEDDEEQARHDQPLRHPVGDRIVPDRVRNDPPPTHVVPHGQVEEREDAFRQDRNRDREDPIREDDRQGGWQDVADHDVPVRGADHLPALDEHPLLEAQHLTADDSGGHGPAGETDHEDDAPQVEVADAGDDEDHEDEEGDGQNDIVEAHDHLVEPAPHVAGDESHPGPDHDCHAGRHDPDDERDLTTPDDLRVDVATEEIYSAEMLRAGMRARRGTRDRVERPIGRAPRRGGRVDEGGNEYPDAPPGGPAALLPG